MKRVFPPVVAFALLLLMSGCSHGVDLTRASSQANFGVQAAKMNLWREALFRFQRAVEINPGDAMARNNLAVAYEANGEFEKARLAYIEALKLDHSNQFIQKNYSRFTEFTGKNKKRQAGAKPDPRDTSAPAKAPADATTPSATSPAPATPTPVPAPAPPAAGSGTPAPVTPPPPPPAPAPPATSTGGSR